MGFPVMQTSWLFPGRTVAAAGLTFRMEMDGRGSVVRRAMAEWQRPRPAVAAAWPAQVEVALVLSYKDLRLF